MGKAEKMENLSRSVVGSERQTEWFNTLVKLETYRYTNHFTKLEHSSIKKFIYIVAVSFLSVAFMGSSFAGVQEKQQQLQG